MEKDDTINDFLKEFENVEQSIEKANGFSDIQIDCQQDTNNIELSNPEQYFICTFRHDDQMDAKQYMKFIKSVEGLIRTCPEYKQYLNYLRNTLGMDRCQVLQNIPPETYSLEFHHHPFTLFQLVDTVLQYFLKQKGQVQTFEVADHVMSLHYKNKVGLVPLQKTAHDLAHSGDLFIDPKQIFGKVGEFINEYKDYINEEDMKQLAKYHELATKNLPVVTNNVLSINDTPQFQGKELITLEDIQACNIITKEGK